MKTFEIGSNQFGEMFIACLICGMESFHPEDIKQEYCGSCHQFHGIMGVARDMDPEWQP